MILIAYFKLFQNKDCVYSKKLSLVYFLFVYVYSEHSTIFPGKQN